MKIGKRIGRGSFSAVFDDEDNKDQVIAISVCPQKEAMSLGLFPCGRRWPKVTRHHDSGLNTRYCDEAQVYTMPKYTKVTAPKRQLSPVDYKAYRQVLALCNEVNQYRDICDSHFNRLAFGLCSHALATQIVGASRAMLQYSSEIELEISPRNVATGPSGGLIFLDLFFAPDLRNSNPLHS